MSRGVVRDGGGFTTSRRLRCVRLLELPDLVLGQGGAAWWPRRSARTRRAWSAARPARPATSGYPRLGNALDRVHDRLVDVQVEGPSPPHRGRPIGLRTP